MKNKFEKPNARAMYLKIGIMIVTLGIVVAMIIKLG
jgi:hypothetical protein